MRLPLASRPRGMAMATPFGFCAAVAERRRPTLTTDTADLRGNEVQHKTGHIEIERFREALPAGDGVDFDGVELAVFSWKQIDAGQRGVDGGGGAAGDFRERIIGREGL